MADPETAPYSAALFESWDAALPEFLRPAASGEPAAISSWFRSTQFVRGSDTRGWRVLHVSVQAGKLEGLQAVLAGLRSRPELELQEELDALTYCGLSPLYMAFDLRRFDLAKALLEAGARPNMTHSAQENEMSLLFQGCLEHLASSSLLPPAVDILELLHKAGARPDRPEVRQFVTPLVVLVQESRSRQLADHPAALELVGHVLRLWPDIELSAGDQENCFLLQSLLWVPIGGVAKALWKHFKSRGLLSWAALKTVEGADDLLCWMLDLGNMEAVTLLLDCGFDPLQWTSGQEEAEVAGEADCHMTEEEFMREPAGDAPEDTRLANTPFYRNYESSVCPLSAAMTRGYHEIVWRMLELRPDACGLFWQEFVESCRVSGAFPWLLRVAKQRGPTWRPPALPAAARRFASRGLLRQFSSWRTFVAAPTIVDWALLEWTERNEGRFPLSPRLSKAYFRVLLHSRGALDSRPSPALLAALTQCPEDEAAAWAALLEEAPVANSLRSDSNVADGLFRLTLHREPLFRAAVALGARPSSTRGLMDLLKNSQRPAPMWAVAAVLVIANGSSPTNLEPRGSFPLEWLAIAALRKVLERNGHRTEHQIRSALSSIKLPVKLHDIMVLAEASGPWVSHKAVELCCLPVNKD